MPLDAPVTSASGRVGPDILGASFTTFTTFPPPPRVEHPVGRDLAAFEHQRDAVGFLQDRNVSERIPVDDDQVGEFAVLDRPQLALAAEALGGPPGRRPQRLERAQTGIGEALDLDRVFRVTVAAGVGAGGDLDPGRDCPAQALDVVFLQMVRPFADMRQGRFAVKIVYRKGRHEEDAALGHRIEQFGLFVEVTAVLDRIDAGLDRNA